MQRVLGDARRAEALFFITLVMLLLTLLLGQYLAWAFLKPVILATPTGPAAVAFWLAHLGVLALCTATCVFGFKPAVTITLTPAGLHLLQGRRALTLTYDAIHAAEPIPALLFHRHYGRYAATQTFVNRFTPELLLLKTVHGVVVVGPLPEDHAALLHLLEATLAPVFAVTAARVA